MTAEATETLNHTALKELHELRESYDDSSNRDYVQGRIDEFVAQNAVTDEELAAAAHDAGTTVADYKRPAELHARMTLLTEERS